MTRNPISSQTFFERAGREARRYGEDPWVFLRELVQNSRDAEARDISFSTYADASRQTIVCRDNGRGMSADHIRQYLLRLYASSKENDESAIGFYGVGFWSILLFQPDRICIASTFEGRAEALEISCRNFEIKAILPPSHLVGTEITLIRKSDGKGDDASAFAAKISERLIYYAAHVRPLPGKKSLSLFCNGERLNRDFPMPEHLGKRLKSNKFDGVIGFSSAPAVRIYKAGILVRDLISLAEVIPSRKSRLSESGWGLYPFIAINIDDLEVLMDRQKVFEDPLLYQAVQACEKALLKMHGQLVQQLYPLNWKNRIFNYWRRLGEQRWFRWRSWYWVSLLLIGLPFFPGFERFLETLPRGGGFVHGWAETAGQGYLDLALEGYSGTIIDRKDNHPVNWQFNYQGPPHLLFHMRTFDRYDPTKGLVPTQHHLRDAYPEKPHIRREKVAVHLKVSGERRLFSLPIPNDYTLIPDSLKIAGEPAPRVWENQHGEAVIQLRHAMELSYQTALAIDPEPMPLTVVIASLPWPEEYRNLIERAQGMRGREAAGLFSLFIKEHFVYTRTAASVKAFREAPGQWLDKVLRVEGGDCDVLNGLFVLLMQSAGFSAQLRVGIIGDHGKARSDFHAWARFYDRGWQRHDVTEIAASSIAATPAAGDPGERSAETVIGTPSGAVGENADDPYNGLRAADVARGKSRIPWPKSAFLLLLLPALVLVLVLRRKRIGPLISQPRFVGDLFHHYLSQTGAGDPLRLQFRSIFPMLKGGDLSLFELRKHINNGILVGAFPDCPLLERLAPEVLVLDRSAPMVKILFPFLPQITWLEEVTPLFEPGRLWPILVTVENTIKQLDPAFRLYQDPDSSLFREIYLPLRRGGRAVHHLILGERHPQFQNWRDLDPYKDEQVFEVLEILLNKTTFYLREKEAFLLQVAQTIAGRDLKVGAP